MGDEKEINFEICHRTIFASEKVEPIFLFILPTYKEYL